MKPQTSIGYSILKILAGEGLSVDGEYLIVPTNVIFKQLCDNYFFSGGPDILDLQLRILRLSDSVIHFPKGSLKDKSGEITLHTDAWQIGECGLCSLREYIIRGIPNPV